MNPDLGVLDAQQIAETAPAFVAAAGSAVVLIRWYRSRVIQLVMPGKLKWDNLPKMARLGIVFVASLAASMAAALAAGESFMAGLIAAVPVAFTAVGSHKATKAVGHKQTLRAVEKKGIKYEPGSIRTAISPIFPVDQRRLGRLRELRKEGDRHEP